jgi:SAM-dependent methyltransferase
MENHELYSSLARICAKFYDLAIDASEVADFVDARMSRFKPRNVLFVGGFFSVAKELAGKGYDITVADYTDEMVAEGKKRLPGTKVVKADIRNLPFENEFDAVVVIGRVFTHMYTEDDLRRAFQAIRKSLKAGGILFFDNYEDTKIAKTDYFNGKITGKGTGIEIIRDSSTEIVSEKPFIVKWKAVYTVKENGKVKTFNDEMEHRAFSRQEIKRALGENGFRQIGAGGNFDETSFYTIAAKETR